MPHRSTVLYLNVLESEGLDLHQIHEENLQSSTEVTGSTTHCLALKSDSSFKVFTKTKRHVAYLSALI